MMKFESLRFVVNGNNQITQVVNQYQTRENYHYDQNGYISRQYIQADDYRYHNDHHGQIKIDNLDLYQKGNKLNRIGNDYYSYDKAGRLVKKTAIKDGFRGKTLYYRWNGNNQLESLTNEWGEVWYYKYDALGRRIEKACPQRNTKTTYLWDGDQVAYQETEKHGKTESLRHCIFNGWELIAQQDSYFKTDLAIIIKLGRKPQTMRSASLTVNHLLYLILKTNALGVKPRAAYGVCLCSKAGKANKLNRLTQIYFLPGNILTKKVDWPITVLDITTHKVAVI